MTSHLPLALSLHTVRLTTSHVVGPGHDSDHRNKSNEAPTSWHNHGGWSTLKITFKDKDGLNLGSWDHGVLENGCSSIVIIDQFWDGSFIYRPIGIWSFVYQLIGIWSFIYVCSAAQHSFLVCQRARRIAIHSIFSPTERVMR